MTDGKRGSGEGQRGGGDAGKQETARWAHVLSGSMRVGALLFAFASPLPRVPASLHAQTSLTIYNDGRVLVRRTLQTAIPKGASTQRLALGALDPATLFSLDSTVNIERISYDGAVDEASVLRRSVGKRLVFRLSDPRDTVSALVLGVDPLRLQMPDGRISFQAPGEAFYPSDLVVVEPTAVVGVQSSKGQDQIRVGYFTTGASWQASYQVVLGRPDARVTGMAVIPSQSLRAENAEIRLLAGSVSRAGAPEARQDKLMARRMAVSELAMSDGAATEQKVGEFHLYSLPGRSTLLPGLTTSVAFFEPAQVKYERNYVVHGDVPYWGFLPQMGEETEPPVEVIYTLKRPRKTDFGDRPLPGGVARLYLPDSSGGLQLVGEASLNHTPAGSDMKLNAGTAFDITAKRLQMNYATRRDSTKARGVYTVATADYRVTLKNATDSVVTVDVEEERAGEWSVVSSSVPAEKVSSTISRFRVRVPARGEAVLTYKIRVIW
ncbi:MAG TPA: hypothetical protein VGR09_02015 [Gemmatimonadales bacterium]|nr:hypothetical protein [Gemmatimonadales bacterium]